MTATCRVCPAQVVWVETDDGRRVPLDLEPTLRGNYAFTAPDRVRLIDEAERKRLAAARTPLYLDHHATCPLAMRVRAGELRGQGVLF